MRKLFGTDGIRGRANTDPMTVETATALGRALTAHLLDEGRRAKVIIGKDTRLSGYMFETALAAGVCSMGGTVRLVGPLPTPAIAFLTRSIRADAGVVISASHNPFDDNGIKIFGHDGFKLPDALELALEGRMASGDFGRAAPTGTALGDAQRVDDAAGRYVEHLKSTFPGDLRLDGLKIVVDCAHGAAYKVAPAVLTELGARVVRLGCRPNGRNINDRCGALHPERVASATTRQAADLGIALDGDADRLMLADETGRVLDGDYVLAACAKRMKAADRLPGDTIVATVMANLGLEVALRTSGINMIRADVGDRYVVERMREGGFILGGEQSGHLVFMDRSTTGDGMVAALQILAILVREGIRLSEIGHELERYPQTLVNVRVTKKPALVEIPGVKEAILAAEAAMGDEGRVLVRYSGTELKARVMVEGIDDDAVRTWADRIAGEIREAIGAAEEEE